MLRHLLSLTIRQFNRQRLSTGLHLASLGIGMAGAILVFLFIRFHYLTDRHFNNFDRTFRIVSDLKLENGQVEKNAEAMPPLAARLREDYPQVEHATFFITNQEQTIRVNSQSFTEREGITVVDHDFFRVFDHQWLAGKSESLNAHSAILTESWAKKYFGNQNAMGRRLETARGSILVTGIIADAPANSDIKTGLFLSLDALPADEIYRWWYLHSTHRVYATLKEASQVETLQKAMPALLKKAFGAEARYFALHWQPMKEVHFDSRTPGFIHRELIYALGLSGLFLIAMACINFINLTTVQSFQRAKEVGIRKSLGGSYGQLVGQFFLEIIIIALVSLLLAIFIVELFLPTLNNWAQVSLKLEWNWSLFSFLIPLLAGILVLAGLYPSVVLANFKPITALKSEIPAGQAGGLSIRRALIISQFVICQILITGALIIALQTQYFKSADLGFNPQQILLVNLPSAAKEASKSFQNALLQYPEIKNVTLQLRPPLSTAKHGAFFKMEGKDKEEAFPIRAKLADANFLNTYDLRLIAGRNINPGDSIREYVVNESLLHKLGINDPNQIIGKKLDFFNYPNHVPLPIVGVVQDFHHLSLHEAIEPCLIASQLDAYTQAGIKLNVNELGKVLPRIKSVWTRIYPDQPFEYQWFDDTIIKSYHTENSLSSFIWIVSGISVWICGLGLFGLIRFMAETRTKEVGIRKVLGASEWQIIFLFAKSFLWMALLAFILATPVTIYILDQWLQQFAYHIQLHWFYFMATFGFTIILSILTIGYQSWRTARMNPSQSLKSE